MQSIKEIFEFLRTNIALIAVFVLSYFCFKSFQTFTNQSKINNEVALKIADSNQQKIRILLKEKQALQDSATLLRAELNSVIKIAVAIENTLKVPPNEAKILSKYTSLSDSAAYRIYMQRYGRKIK